jgi:hypothetical protein
LRQILAGHDRFEVGSRLARGQIHGWRGSKPILFILESAKSKPNFIESKKESDFQREDPFYRDREKREERSFLRLISKRGGVYLVF